MGVGEECLAEGDQILYLLPRHCPTLCILLLGGKERGMEGGAEVGGEREGGERDGGRGQGRRRESEGGERDR